MSADNGLELAHRTAYRLTYRAPGLMRVCRRCDNSAKLTENDVRAIRADKRARHVIAADYGVHLGTISSIRKRRTWRHVK